MPLFGSSKKNPQELVRAMREQVLILENKAAKGAQLDKKVQDELYKNMLIMKTMVLGNPNAPSDTSEIVSQLSHELFNSSDTLGLLIKDLKCMDFECRKEFSRIFQHLLRRQVGCRTPNVDHLCRKPEMLFDLLHKYEDQEIAIVGGMMLRECCRVESLARILLYDDSFYRFFDYVELSTFDIASDAFATFKELLIRHKVISSQFLESNYDRFFASYQKLLSSDNYVTRRQALKLLGELLLDRHNFTVMTRYISSPDNLKLMMNMLREKSRNIQFEAFHVFKVFVANPNKPKPILDILLRNKERLIDFLTKFHTERSEDEQFNDEKTYLILQIKELGKTTEKTLDSTDDSANTKH